MENTLIAKRIGYRQAFKAITVVICVFYIFIAYLHGPFWIIDFNFTITLSIAVPLIYWIGYLLGGLAGKFIIVKKFPAILVGIISGFLIFWIGIFFINIIDFLNSVLPYTTSLSAPIEEFIFKQILLVTYWAFIPLLGTGIWYGLSINGRGKKLNKA